MVQLHAVATGPDRDFGNVCFVHGLTGRPFTTWGGISDEQPLEGQRFWLRWIANEPGLDRLAFYSLEYEAPRFKGVVELEQIVKRDRTVLDCLVQQDEFRRVPTAFICHSLGGLIIKSMILLASEERATRPAVEEFFANVAQVVFLGTPHLGSHLAQVVRSLRRFGWRPSALIDDLANEGNLKRLNERYIGLARNHRKGLDHLVFRETEKTGGIFGVMVVPPDSADPVIPDVTPIDVPEADPNEVCTPADKNAPVYVKTVELLRRLPDAVPYLEAGWSSEFDDFTNHYTEGPIPFGGRDRELEHLDRWLSDDNAEPTLLLSSPAGARAPCSSAGSRN